MEAIESRPSTAASTTSSQDVEELFKRFDQNSDGNISEKELAHVFKGIDPVYWDDLKIAGLMEAADTSKDGCIRYSEFIAWVFGEDAEWELAKQAALLNDSKTIRGTLVRNTRSSETKSPVLTVTLDMSEPHSKLGIKIEGSNGKVMIIKSIAPHGKLAYWNSQNKNANVCLGDRILSVNGQGEGDMKAIMRELKTGRNLEMEVLHGPTKVDHTVQLEDSYDIDSGTIDEGRFSTIRRVTHKESRKDFAVKIIDKTNIGAAAVESEILMMTTVMNHPNIAKLMGVYEDYHDMSLVMELCRGGELLEKILAEYDFSESEVARVMQQAMSAVYHMHALSVCHRDVRPEHFLLAESTAISCCTLKLTDFGMASRFSKDEYFRTRASNCYYFSPQMVDKRYQQECDMWSCGIMMYVLLVGYPPFAGETDAETCNLILKGELAFVDGEWDDISEGAQSLLRRLLSYRPRDRATAPEALDHHWLRGFVAGKRGISLVKGQKKMKDFHSYNKLKKASLNAIAMRLPEQDISNLKDMFAVVDANADGTVTFHELHDGIYRLGHEQPAAEIRAMMEEIDVDGNRRIDYTEFIAATLSRKKYREESACWSAFHLFDRNGNGRLGRKELADVLENSVVRAAVEQSSTAHKALTRRAVTEVLTAIDRDSDGEIDFEEFMAMMYGGPLLEEL